MKKINYILILILSFWLNIVFAQNPTVPGTSIPSTSIHHSPPQLSFNLECENGKVKLIYNDKENDYNLIDQLGSGSCSLVGAETLSTNTLTSQTFTHSSEYYEIEDVLQASAATFSEEWGTDGDTNCSAAPSSGAYNPYAQGNKGIWRLHETFAYVENREQDGDADGEVDLQTDGVYTLELFDWEDPTTNECTQRWRKVEEVTKYSINGAAIESKDALGIYSSALYGYNNYLPIAVAANAGYYEVGYEGFEELGIGTLDNTSSMESGHLRFMKGCSDYELNQATVEAYFWNVADGFNTYILVPLSSLGLSVAEVNASNHPFIGKSIKLETTCYNYDQTPLLQSERYVNAEIANISIVYDDIDGVSVSPFDHLARIDYLMQCDGSTFPTGDKDLCFPKNGHAIVDMGYDIGNATSYWGINHITVVNNITDVSHTGSKSLKVSGSAIIPQTYLGLQKNEEYVISAWVYIDNGNLSTYENLAYLGYGNAGAMPSGNIIEGWQRIEHKFTYNGYADNIILGHFGTDFYIDDIRIFPADGNIQTYVYNPVDYRVEAILDNNNFFTMYDYDSEGNVISVSKETYEGIKTIQEAGSYIRKNPLVTP